MAQAALVFAVYFIVASIAVVIFWGLLIRYGESSDLDPESWLVRVFRHRDRQGALLPAASPNMPVDQQLRPWDGYVSDRSLGLGSLQAEAIAKAIVLQETTVKYAAAAVDADRLDYILRDEAGIENLGGNYFLLGKVQSSRGPLRGEAPFQFDFSKDAKLSEGESPRGSMLEVARNIAAEAARSVAATGKTPLAPTKYVN